MRITLKISVAIFIASPRYGVCRLSKRQLRSSQAEYFKKPILVSNYKNGLLAFEKRRQPIFTARAI
jgi:hypothetical protein